MLKEKYPYYLANEAVFANTDLEVTDKYSGEVATRVAMADAKTIDEAIAWSVKAEKAMAALAPYERQAILNHCVKRFQERAMNWRRRCASRPANRSRMPAAKSHA